MRATIDKRLIVAVYLAVTLGSCAVGDDVTLPAPDDAATADDTPDVPVAPPVDTPAVPEDTQAPRDVIADVPAVPRDAGPRADSLPTGSVMFFQSSVCPGGWEPYLDGAGRAVAVAANATLIGYRIGSQLGDREVRGHTHNYSGSFVLGSVSYVGVVGGANTGTSAAGEVRYDAQSSMDPSGLPYVQLLVCRKTGPVLPQSQALPSGLMIFTTEAACPTGFSQPVSTRGRVMVGLAPNAQDGASFGGTPLGPDTPALHTHPTTAVLTTAGHGIALASGCCGSGYARNDTYRVMGRTDGNEPGMPTIQLLQCQRD